MDIPKIPGYEILEALPRGSMSVVFKARQLSLNRIVALKTLPGDLARGAADIEQFLAEARLTANLNHPNIVRVYDFGKSEDGVYYFAMHYVKGYSIASWIRRKGFLSEIDTLLVAQTIAEALKYAWQKAGVIHCDIKPANVIVDDDGTVKVVDLGVAQSIDHVMDRKKTEEDIIAGTPEYMAPEQVRGDRPLDIRVDIYALGAMMYHCLTGKAPFDGHPPMDIMALQETGFIQDPQHIRPDLSVAISCLVETFMAKDRRFRHASWVEAHQDIKRVLKGQLPERILPSEGTSTVTRSSVRARHIEEMKQVLRPPQAEPPVYYDLFNRNDQTIAHKTAKKQKLPASAKLAFLGLVAIAVVLTGLVLRNMMISKSSSVDNLPITASGNSSPILDLATVPLPMPALSPSRGGGERNPREMLETAIEWARTNNTCYDDVIGKFKQVADQTRGTPQAITATEELGKWVERKQQAVEAELKVISDKAADLANQGRLLDAAKLLDDYSGPWRNETLAERGRRALDYRNRFKLQEEEISNRLAEANRLLIHDVSTNGVVVEQNTDAEKQRVQSNTNLSQVMLDGDREQRENVESKTIEAIHPQSTQKESSSMPVPPTVTAKPEFDIAGLKSMLLKHNPGLTAEQITVQVLDGKVVRLEIISLNVRDIRSVGELTDLQAFVCIAFKSDENNDSAKSAPIEDLTPLKGLRLRELNLYGTRVKDLTPLIGAAGRLLPSGWKTA